MSGVGALVTELGWVSRHVGMKTVSGSRMGRSRDRGGRSRWQSRGRRPHSVLIFHSVSTGARWLPTDRFGARESSPAPRARRVTSDSPTTRGTRSSWMAAGNTAGSTSWSPCELGDEARRSTAVPRPHWGPRSAPRRRILSGPDELSIFSAAHSPGARGGEDL
jgi:hypothetical protein